MDEYNMWRTVTSQNPVHKGTLAPVAMTDYKIATFDVIKDKDRICDWLIVATPPLDKLPSYMAEIQIVNSRVGVVYAVRVVRCDGYYKEVNRFAIEAYRHPATVLGNVVNALAEEIEVDVGATEPADAGSAVMRFSAFIAETTKAVSE